MVVDPGEAPQVEASASAGDGDVGETGLGIIDGVGDGGWRASRLSGGVVEGTGEVLGDEDAGPFTSLGLVGGGDGDVCVRFGDEPGEGGEDGVSAVGVDEVDQGLQVPARKIVGGVVLQVAPAGKEEEFGVVGAAAFFEVAGCEGQGVQAVSSPARATWRPAAMWAMTWAMTPTLVRHRTASGCVTRPSSVGTAGVP